MTDWNDGLEADFGLEGWFDTTRDGWKEMIERTIGDKIGRGMWIYALMT